jgi:galactokinase
MTEQSDLTQIVCDAFKEKFGSAPTLVAKAPGRVNLIGEHTDYNDGFVLPMAIDRAIWMAVRPRDDRRVVLHSLDFDDVGEFSLDAIQRGGLGPIEYVKGVAFTLGETGLALTGFDGVMKGNVPIGAGLSSSAALELVTARILTALAGAPWDPVTMAKLAQRAENQWVGMNCGIMDQLISAAGQEGQALLIDCRSLELKQTPLPTGTVVVVMDTNTRRGEHGHMDSAYNERREQCEEAARIMGVSALRDVSMAQLEASRKRLSELTYRRARHVVSENERTLKVYRTMLADDPTAMGQLMNEGHDSISQDFEVSSEALDAMAEIAQAQPGCFGARMTGGGFAGCAVALVDANAADTFTADVTRLYEERTGIEPQLYVCHASAGASLVD